MIDDYTTPGKRSITTIREKGSKFIGIAFYAPTLELAMSGLEEIKKEYYDASHHCYAYKIGTEDELWRANDDGEPSGSAGRPILGQISSAGLVDIMVVVVRYFGGTKLGVSGLIKAYKEAAALAIAESGTVTRTRFDDVEITFPYQATSDVQRIISAEEAIIREQSFTENCVFVISIPCSRSDSFIKKFDLLEAVTVIKITANS